MADDVERERVKYGFRDGKREKRGLVLMNVFVVVMREKCCLMAEKVSWEGERGGQRKWFSGVQKYTPMPMHLLQLCIYMTPLP